MRPCLRKGGINVSDDEEVLEQIALVLDVIKFHASEFSNVKFPRKVAMEHVLHVIGHQPRLSKEASSVLIDLGEAVRNSVSRDEVEVLINGMLFQETHVRNSCLQALQPFDLTDLDQSTQLWVACHDDDEQNARLANHAWEDNGLDVPENFVELLDLLGHDNAYVRTSSTAAIAEAVEHHPQPSEKAKILAPEFDQYVMVIAQSLDRADPWPTRVTIAGAFGQLAPSFPDVAVESFFNFLTQDESFGDRSPEVRQEMLQAGTTIIKEAVIILFGRAARHLEAADNRILSIVDQLVKALKTPAEQVQMAVSDSSSMDHLFDELFNAPKYAARRGALYGLAGAIKGLGVSDMKQYDVMNHLRTATEEKKHFELRQGAMFAFETLSSTLGQLFEPYITFILPLLLTAFGDGTADVRDAARDAAQIIIGNMSGYGVKLILPSLLLGLDEKQWWSKKGSIKLLGMMAYCSPRQLGYACTGVRALQALWEVMSVRASTVFPVLIPTLIAMPMTVFNARALASLVMVLEDEKDEELLGALDEALRALLESIGDPERLNTLMLLLLGWTKSDAPKQRTSACTMFTMFCEELALDSFLYRVDWVQQLISLFDDPQVPVHTNLLAAFHTFVKSIPKDNLELLVVPLRWTIDGLLDKVPNYGKQRTMRNTANAVGDLIDRTEESAIKPFVVPFTGPLIRVATQATTYPPGVETAILSALTSMLERIPNHVKHFFPQLQRTVVKSISDPSSIVVHTRAADALGILMCSQPRVDPVVTELIGSSRGSEEEIVASFVLTLSYVVRSASVHGGIGDRVMKAMAGLVASLSGNWQCLKSVVK
ncbi:armadillo-type protein [Melanogaster broomeanus]|nr:armadillo-type protein [Melanogaster broomeanus]